MTAIHFVKCRHKLAGQTHYEWLARGEPREDRASTIEDIVSNEIPSQDITLILEVDTDLGTSRDVTEDFAHEIAKQLTNYEIANDYPWLLDFLQEHDAVPISLMAAE